MIFWKSSETDSGSNNKYFKECYSYDHNNPFDPFKAKIDLTFTPQSRFEFLWELLSQSILKQDGSKIDFLDKTEFDVNANRPIFAPKISHWTFIKSLYQTNRLIRSAVDLKLIFFCRILRGGRHFRSLHKKKAQRQYRGRFLK